MCTSSLSGQTTMTSLAKISGLERCVSHRINHWRSRRGKAPCLSLLLLPNVRSPTRWRQKRARLLTANITTPSHLLLSSHDEFHLRFFVGWRKSSHRRHWPLFGWRLDKPGAEGRSNDLLPLSLKTSPYVSSNPYDRRGVVVDWRANQSGKYFYSCKSSLLTLFISSGGLNPSNSHHLSYTKSTTPSFYPSSPTLRQLGLVPLHIIKSVNLRECRKGPTRSYWTIQLLATRKLWKPWDFNHWSKNTIPCCFDLEKSSLKPLPVPLSLPTTPPCHEWQVTVTF